MTEMADETNLQGVDLLMSVEKMRREERGRQRRKEKRRRSVSPTEEEQTKSHRKVESTKLKDAEEAELENIIFGSGDWIQPEQETVRHSLKDAKFGNDHIESLDDEAVKDSDEEEVEHSRHDQVPVEEKSVWEDDDEQFIVESEIGGTSSDKVVLSARLREKHEKIFSRPKWAVKAEQKVRDEEADQLLRTTSNFIDRNTASRPLTSGSLDFTHCPQMNKFCFQRSPLVAVGFHPSSEIAMVAHKNGAMTFLNVDAKECNKIQSVYFKDFDVSCAKLSHDGMQMLVGSARHRTLHCYDLMSGHRTQVTFPKAHELTHMKRFEVSPCGRYLAIHGRFGNVYIICAETKQQLGTLKMNEDVTSTVFTRDGRMFSHGGNYIYLWDIAARRCIQKFLDDGCLKGQTMALSPDERFLATGCDSGIVNVYDGQHLLKGRESSRTPKPLKCLKNIVTPVTSLTFNPSSEILLAASRYKPEAVKMAHMDSMTVFSNFPNVQHKINSCSAASFSPNGGFLALGTTLGAANLIRLSHYGNY